MARKKITPEEETPKTVALEESTAADVGDMTQNDLPPGESGTAEDCGTEAVPTTEPAEDADGMSVPDFLEKRFPHSWHKHPSVREPRQDARTYC